LHQFSEADLSHKVIATYAESWYQGLVEGLSVMPLHEFESEHVALVKWAPNTQFSSHRHWGGEEIFVIEGTFYDEHGTYPQGSWIRSPHLSQHKPFTKDDGALIYVKTGHLNI
jgi:anti-sigma factor ChrR (cupin superfamily)